MTNRLRRRCILLSYTHIPQDSIATLSGRIANHSQNIKTGSDTNTTVSLEVMASCCNLHTEREKLILIVTVFIS